MVPTRVLFLFGVGGLETIKIAPYDQKNGIVACIFCCSYRKNVLEDDFCKKHFSSSLFELIRNFDVSNRLILQMITAYNRCAIWYW
jgi:hypothetical protein